MSWKSRIVLDEKILTGKPVIRGTRISVEHIVALLGEGWTNEQILKNYSVLKKQDIEAALKYAAETLKQEKTYLIH
ncbi:MAG TPA: DUF433 domain-containing protein [Nitrososphaerales archaeon]|nr:DUF433 domain-containing protein [Nitrososphaerales archaeon]